MPENKDELLTIRSSIDAEQPYNYSAGKYRARFITEIRENKRFIGVRCPKCKKVYHLEFKPPEAGRYCINCESEVIQRSDDTEEKIKSRLNEFREKALSAIRYLKKNKIPVVKVPGHLEVFTPENVRKSVMDEIKKLY